MILLVASLLLTNLTAVSTIDRPDVPFEIEGIVSFVSHNQFALENGSETLYGMNHTKDPFIKLRPGDHVHCFGKTTKRPGERVIPSSTRIEILSHTTAPVPVNATIQEITSGRLDAHLVRVASTVGECFFDEIDPNFGFTELKDDADSVFIAWKNTPENVDRFTGLIGAKVILTGVPTLNVGVCRKHMGRLIVTDKAITITILERPARHPFDAPDIKSISQLEPSQIARAGQRRATGTVLAVRPGRKILLQSDDGEIFSAELATRKQPPLNALVEVVGSVASDLFRLSLLRASWRYKTQPETPAPNALPNPTDVALRQLFSDAAGQSRFNARLFDRPIRVYATVKTISTVSDDATRIYLQENEHLLPVELGFGCSLPDDLEPGCFIQVSGIAVAESDNWSPNTPFPQIHGIVLTTRTSDDIIIIRRPPWWTPQRLFICVCVLLIALAGIILWNLALRRAIRRRECELKAEILAHVESKMKIRERTQLAVELHDTLSQGLTGVSMELNTAEELADDKTRMMVHLARASLSLKSCRNELKNCLWDLRTNTLGITDVNEAVRRTLLPVISGCDLTIRFSVRRERIPDKHAQAMLRIVRELAVNAVHHGNATQLTIAGSIEDNWLKFSVKDNGSGFDPQRIPGITQGHFGLQGIHERVKRFDGTFEINSLIGKGTKASIRFRVTDEQDRVS